MAIPIEINRGPIIDTKNPFSHGVTSNGENESIGILQLHHLRPMGYGTVPGEAMHLVKRLYGDTARRFVVDAKRNPNLSVQDTNGEFATINTHFFNNVRKILGLPENTDMRSFYGQALGRANETVNTYIRTVFPDLSEMVGLRSEIITYSTQPHDLLRLIAQRRNGMLAFQAERQLVLGGLAMELEAYALRNNLTDELATVERFFEDRLYDHADQDIYLTTYAWHDNKTNKALGIAPSIEVASRTRPDGSVHLKRHTRQVRHVPEIGEVLTDFNVKKPDSTSLKIIRKGYKKLQEKEEPKFEPGKDSPDMIRGTFMVAGATSLNDPRVDHLINNVSGLLHASSVDPDQTIRPIENIWRDDFTLSKKRREGEPNKFKRLQVKFEGVPVPFEIMFYDELSHINSRYDTGKADPVTGILDGHGHPVWEVARLIEIMPWIINPDMYPNLSRNHGIDLYASALKTQESIADGLKRERRILIPPSM